MKRDLTEWEELQRLFHLAEEAPTADLNTLLAGATTDAGVREHARRLILAARAEAVIDGSARATDGGIAEQGRIGPYTIVRLLGSGGMGTVYLAERLAGSAVQHVAVKVLTSAAAEPLFLERFAREQHILISLNHSNITRMLDAGVAADGRPFLVMEYVDGDALDLYCDEQRLTIAQRLELFLHLCEPVAYAHLNLVAHLDLKPGNVLVQRGTGAVKLLDFGTSKLIVPDGLSTVTVMATPAYASPEQLLNQPVTTASDVYSLGAILFELLSGRRPNGEVSLGALVERAVHETRPEPMRTAVTSAAAVARNLTETRLGATLAGDLETIVAKCLAARPRDRYHTVEALAADVRNYLAGRPISARPQTTTYRIAKFVRRNRSAVAASMVAVVLLITVGSYAAWRQHQAVLAGRRAMQMQTFLYNLIRVANSKYTGKPAATVPEMLRTGVTVLPQFISDPADQRRAQLALAASMFDNSDDADARPVFQSLIDRARAAGDDAVEAEASAYAATLATRSGDVGASSTLARRALALMHADGVTPSARVRIEVLTAGNEENNGARTDSSLRLLRAAVKESEAAGLSSREQAFAAGQLAGFLEQRGDLAEAEPVLRKAAALYGSEPYAECDQAETFGDLAYVRGAQNDIAGSVLLFRKAYTGLVACSGADTRSSLMMQAHLAGAMLKAHQAADVVPMLEASLPAWRKISGNSPDLANPMIFLARAYLADKQYTQAESMAAQTVAVQAGKIAAKTYRMGVSELVWAQALAAQGRNADASLHAQRAVDGVTANPAKTAAQKETVQQAQELVEALKNK